MLPELLTPLAPDFPPRENYLVEKLFFILFQRTKAAAAAAAALVPTALAAASTSTAADSSNSASLEDLVKLLVEDMQMFKRLARKSLNLLQGMEMVHAGHMFAINSATGNPYTVARWNSF